MSLKIPQQVTVNLSTKLEGKTTVDKCIHCNKETALYRAWNPVCETCDALIEERRITDLPQPDNLDPSSAEE